MIRAEDVKEIINYTAEDLTRLIQDKYPGDNFLAAEFLGVNNTSKFVFSVDKYIGEDEDEGTETWCTTKVFVGRYNGLIGADY